MTWVVVEGIIKFSPNEVFELLADYPRLGHSSPSVDKIVYTSEQKRGVGTKTHWTAGVSVETEGGAVVEWDEEVTDFVENKLVGFKVISGEFPSVGFLRVYPRDEGKSTFIIFAEHHQYAGANVEKVEVTMRDQIKFMEKELAGELKDRSHKRSG
ncbi:MAG: SRPBCC family protein [Candidatus Ranarchaeia archaeon]|jgi:uncharacterized membrane protein